MPDASRAGLRLVSVGLMSSLGEVVPAAAAQRAGLSRRAPLLDYSALDSGDDSPEAPVIGAPIGGFSDGFMHVGVWVRLALAALENLAAYGGLPTQAERSFWPRTRLAWILPELDFARFGLPEDDVPALLEADCAKPLADLLGWPLSPQQIQFHAAGACGAAAALARFERDAARGELDRIVLLATDSWLDPMSMRMLLCEDRVKTAEKATGLCPGELGAAALVEVGSAADRRGARSDARIEAVVTQPGKIPFGEDPVAARVASAPELGVRLSRALRQAARASGPQPFRGDLSLDLNGEVWRAAAWGHAQPHLLDAIDFAHCAQVVPAVSFGDTGAASAVLGLCLAARAFVRGYAAETGVLVASVGEDGSASAIGVARP